jgi:hypothetical protein
MHFLFCFLLLLAAAQSSGQTPEAKLAELSIQLPAIPAPIASYVHDVKTGNLLFLTGKGPQQPGGDYIKGNWAPA